MSATDPTWTVGHIERVARILQEALEVEVGNIVGKYTPKTESLSPKEAHIYAKGVQSVITLVSERLFDGVADAVENLSYDEAQSLERNHDLDYRYVIAALDGAAGERAFRDNPKLPAFDGRLRWLNQTIAEIRQLRVYLGEHRDQHVQIYAVRKLRGWGEGQWYYQILRELDRRLGNCRGGKPCDREDRPAYEQVLRELQAAHRLAYKVDREISERHFQALEGQLKFRVERRAA